MMVSVSSEKLREMRDKLHPAASYVDAVLGNDSIEAVGITEFLNWIVRLLSEDKP